MLFRSVSQSRYSSPRYVGSYKCQIGIGEITATATSEGGTGTSTLGQISGKGIGSDNGHVKIHTDEFGILMGIHYIVPQQQYNNDQVDLFATKLVRNDFYQPSLTPLVCNQ